MIPGEIILLHSLWLFEIFFIAMSHELEKWLNKWVLAIAYFP